MAYMQHVLANCVMDRREVKTEGSGVKRRGRGRPPNFNAPTVTKHLIIQHTGKREHIVVEKDEDLGEVARSQTGYLRNKEKTGYLKSSETTTKQPRPLPWKQRSPRSRATPRPVQVYDVDDEDDDDPQPISTEIDAVEARILPDQPEAGILPDQPPDNSRLTDGIDSEDIGVHGSGGGDPQELAADSQEMVSDSTST